MKKISVMMAIIAVCLLSSFTHAQTSAYVSATCVINDNNFTTGCGWTYDVYIKVTSLYTDNTGFIYFSTYTSPVTAPITNFLMSTIHYVYPATADYYTITIGVTKNYNDFIHQPVSRSDHSYGGNLLTGGKCYLTADNQMAVYF